jgi:hypothetical protein
MQADLYTNFAKSKIPFKSLFMILSISGLAIGIFGGPKNRNSILINYRSSSQSIEIKNTSMTLSTKKDVFDSPMSSIPSSTKVEETKFTLTKTELSDLIQFIQSSEFFQLDTEYGAPKEERSYPTTISIKLDNNSKEVVYRSNPSYEAAPDSFSKVEIYLLNLRK